jgi:hypothetical protein
MREPTLICALLSDVWECPCPPLYLRIVWKFSLSIRNDRTLSDELHHSLLSDWTHVRGVACEWLYWPMRPREQDESFTGAWKVSGAKTHSAAVCVTSGGRSVK